MHTRFFSFSLLRGAGQEVGRSCIMLEFKNKKIMVKMHGSLLHFVQIMHEIVW